MVEKNLFLHDLAIVAVIKDEAHYLKEWMDYHLAAGVDHFYLYDNGSTDETRALLEPYIKTRFVDYISVPGSLVQIPAYNDAVHRFRFACRYMAFIDCDEFIFPKSTKSVVEVVDETLAGNPQAAALAVNWQIFGSNGHEKADFSDGVLERFTHRAQSDWFEPMTENKLPLGNIHVKTIANPRFVRYLVNPHYAYYLDGAFAVNSNGNRVLTWSNEPVLTDKIVVNHYFTKSKEEFLTKMNRSRDGVDAQENRDFAALDMERFEKNDRNEVFDDGILAYRKVRIEQFTVPKKPSREDFFKTLERILMPVTRSDAAEEIFVGNLETFLTCRSLAGALRRNFPNDNRGRYLEEAALKAINRTCFTKLSLPEILMMFNSLPSILTLPYPAVAELHKNCMNFARQIMNDYRINLRWERFVDMGNFIDLLAAFGARLNVNQNPQNKSEG